MSDPVSILIADDRPENLLALEELLREEEIEVVRAASGREALGLSLKHEFALVLLDVQMPDMDGFETAELMRGNPKTRSLPIIFVTAGEKSSSNLFKGYESGAVDYIYKPIDPIILRSKVRVFSELYRQRRAIQRQEQSLERLVEERTRDLGYSEDRYRRLLESVSSYVYTVFCQDEVPVRTEHGRGCEAVSGYTPEDYATDSWLWLRLVPEADRPLVEAFNRRLLAEKCTLTIEHRLLHRDGSLRWIQNTLVPRLSTEGILLSYDGVISDITQRRKAEEELCQALELASAASKTKNEFLANMSHEIRTPMTGIMGAIDLLRDDSLADEQKQYLDIINVSTNNLLRLIDDILDLSKIEVGKVAIDNRNFSVRTCLEEVITIQKGRIDDKGLRFSLNIAPEVPQTVCGDPLRLKQIILNLLGNAIKFTQRGAIDLGVAVAQKNNEFVTLQFRVSDTGIGINKEALDRIFQPFEQADSSATRRFGGSGLGLSICQRLTDLMGGGIQVESTEGAGSSFIVSLPMAIADTPAAARGDEAVPSLPRVWQGPKHSVLLVEDSPISQKVIQKMLAAMGHSVVTANNGREALSVLSQGHFDLVLMDIQMPILDGLDALVQIRGRERLVGEHQPVVAVTAHALVGDREKYLASGFDEYLAKPFKQEELFKIITHSLHDDIVPPATGNSSQLPH